MRKAKRPDQDNWEEIWDRVNSDRLHDHAYAKLKMLLESLNKRNGSQAFVSPGEQFVNFGSKTLSTPFVCVYKKVWQ